jgi:acyl transferase domain-containing protein
VFGAKGVYIGSVKPNLGHSEGASGISSLIKAILALEHKTIPPNIKLNAPNPKSKSLTNIEPRKQLTETSVPFSKYNLTVPVAPTPFPTDRAERISINSFGIGGTNAHVRSPLLYYVLLEGSLVLTPF